MIFWWILLLGNVLKVLLEKLEIVLQSLVKIDNNWNQSNANNSRCYIRLSRTCSRLVYSRWHRSFLDVCISTNLFIWYIVFFIDENLNILVIYLSIITSFFVQKPSWIVPINCTSYTRPLFYSSSWNSYQNKLLFSKMKPFFLNC